MNPLKRRLHVPRATYDRMRRERDKARQHGLALAAHVERLVREKEALADRLVRLNALAAEPNGTMGEEC